MSSHEYTQTESALPPDHGRDNAAGATVNGVRNSEKQDRTQERLLSPDSEKEESRRGLTHRVRRKADALTKPTEADVLDAETRLIPRHYIFQRPRALQYTYRGERINYGGDAAPIAHEISHNSTDVKYSAEGISKARERLDLFIDLVWVGIISNISEVFSVAYFGTENNAGTAFLEFILVFLPAWRIWNFLREFLNSFYSDDTLQRVFVFWVLVLSVFFGNNIAFFPEHPQRIKLILITLYLFIRASFLVMQLVYSFWIPWLRKLILIGVLVSLPSTGLWIAAIYLEGGAAIGPALAAIVWEYAVPVLMDSPAGDRFTPGDYHKEVDPLHLRSRMGSFLIITVGEGVLTLVRGGPLGQGITPVASLGVWSLLIYFVLTYLYFTRDSGVRYVPAVRHRGWRLIIWISTHIPIFASYITLSSGILYFINANAEVPLESLHQKRSAGESSSQTGGEGGPELTIRAFWVIAISLSIIMFSYTVQALLDKPLDPPGTLLINKRLARLAARPVYILVVCLVLLKEDINVYLYFGICGLGLNLVILYELIASLEKPAGLFEPKGLTVLMKKEYRSRAPQAGAPAHIVV